MSRIFEGRREQHTCNRVGRITTTTHQESHESHARIQLTDPVLHPDKLAFPESIDKYKTLLWINREVARLVPILMSENGEYPETPRAKI